MLSKKKLARLKYYDWRTTVRDGRQLTEQIVKTCVVVDNSHIGWKQLREAATVSRIADSAPTCLGFPAKSAVPDGVDKGDRKRLKRGVYLKASGIRARVLRDKTGLNYQQLWKAQKDGCLDVWEIILHLA